MDSEFVKPDKEFEKPLRPLTFSDFSGQEKIIEQLILFSATSIKRKEPPHRIIQSRPPEI